MVADADGMAVVGGWAEGIVACAAADDIGTAGVGPAVTGVAGTGAEDADDTRAVAAARGRCAAAEGPDVRERTSTDRQSGEGGESAPQDRTPTAMAIGRVGAHDLVAATGWHVRGVGRSCGLLNPCAASTRQVDAAMPWPVTLSKRFLRPGGRPVPPDVRRRPAP